MHRISRGVAGFPHRSFRGTRSHPREYLHFILICCACVFTYWHTCALKVRNCPDGGGHGERALLLPRVYLQTVTLMQCNDYFYSRYFGSPFALSGMTPHRPTDYLCGCCHTWLLQLPTLSTITPWEPSPLLFYTFICLSLFSPLSLKLHSMLGYTFNRFGPLSLSLSLCYTFIISSSLPHLPLLDHYTYTPPPLLISTCWLFFRSFSFASTPWSMKTGSYLQSCLLRCADIVLDGNRNADKRNFLACSFAGICKQRRWKSVTQVLRGQPVYWHLSKRCATFIFLY